MYLFHSSYLSDHKNEFDNSLRHTKNKRQRKYIGRQNFDHENNHRYIINSDKELRKQQKR